MMDAARFALGIWVNEDRTVLVRVTQADAFERPEMEVATREHPDAIWGPPVRMVRE